MKKYNIIESVIEPNPINNLWIKDGKLLKFTNGEWQPLTTSPDTSSDSNSSSDLPVNIGNYNIFNILEDGIYCYGRLGRNMPDNSDNETYIVIVQELVKDIVYRSINFNYLIQQTAISTIDSGRVFTRYVYTNDKSVYTEPVTLYGSWNGSSAMQFSGICKGDMYDSAWATSIYDSLANNQMKFFVIGNSAGEISGGYVILNESLGKLIHATDTEGHAANLGDILVIAKFNDTPYYSVLYKHDAKAKDMSKSFPGTYGCMTPNDKMDLQRAIKLLSLSKGNMNECLESGIYPWCTLGRPSGSTSAYTLVVIKSSTPDDNDYYTIEQTCFGRGADTGKIYKRLIFQKGLSAPEPEDYGEWIELSGTSSVEGNVTTDRIVDNAITTNKVADKAITINKIADGILPKIVIIKSDILNLVGRNDVTKEELAAVGLTYEALIPTNNGYTQTIVLEESDNTKTVYNIYNYNLYNAIRYLRFGCINSNNPHSVITVTRNTSGGLYSVEYT